jgi:aerobic-type carbon monoxide dehydrogenase small subunit (CoxS/CutS family)
VTSIRLSVNGTEFQAEVDNRTLLVHFVRENVGLTGTHVGCVTGDCGACTMLVDGRSTKTCSVLAASADGSEITTIEGLADQDGPLHTVQQAFWDEFGFQCGYCLPGMLLTTCELLASSPHPDEAEIVQAINGNLCRCTGYANIVAAIRRAIEVQSSEAPGELGDPEEPEVPHDEHG